MNFSTWRMWRIMKFVHTCHVGIFKISPHDRCGEFLNFSIWECICDSCCFLVFTRFCVEKNWAPNCTSGIPAYMQGGQPKVIMGPQKWSLSPKWIFTPEYVNVRFFLLNLGNARILRVFGMSTPPKMYRLIMGYDVFTISLRVPLVTDSQGRILKLKPPHIKHWLP